jgi:chromosome partitioning protein
MSGSGTLPTARRDEPWVIAIANQKGGVGKSMLSLGLAAVTADSNGTAFMVDVDPQSTTTEIATSAGDRLPFDYAADTNPQNLAKLRNVNDVDMIFVDCPGSLEGHDVLAQILDAADFVIIPFVRDRSTVTPTRRTARMVQDHGVPYRVLINRIDPRRGGGVALLEDAQATLDRFGLPRFRSFVREYVSHQDAHMAGQLITQYRGDRNATEAAADIRRVHTELLLELGKKG